MIILIKGYKYDNSYNYIKLFSSKEQQNNYFDSLEKIYIDENNYIRDNNKIKVGFNYDYLVNEGINYLIFNNGYKDVYAFIIDKEYISKDVTMLHYEVDVLNTYLFDFELKESYVERKVCQIEELTDFDEGLNIGEHIKVSDTVALTKNCEYFALFNGIKEQVPVYDDDGKIVSVYDLPFSTGKPTTKIDGVIYPLYFVPLSQTFSEPTRTELIPPSGGGDGIISAKIYRFLKGYEAFASKSYLDSGGVPTIGYGTTEASGYWDSLFPSCTEKKASEVLAESINVYANQVKEALESDGVDIKKVKQNHFDAFSSLCYNCGLGGVINSPMYKKYIVNQNDSSVADGWERWYIRDNNGNELEGLKLRREAEKNIFNNNVYEYRVIPLVGTNGYIVGSVTDNNGHGFIPKSVKGSV